MNIYLFTAIEIVIYTSIAYFLGRQIGIFTSNDELVNLNYIFWGIFALLSLLANLKLYLYFGSALVISILVLIIYIYKEVTVDFFVEKEMRMYFWILFGIFMITITLLVISKKMMLMAFNSEPPRGDSGPRGDTGTRGKSFFIEPAGDRVYVHVVQEIEKYFREILDKNDVEYDKNEYQFNNMYLKEAISRITNSQQFICSIMQSHDPNVYECSFDGNSSQLPSQMVYTHDMKEIRAQISRNSECKLGASATLTGTHRDAIWKCDGGSHPVYIEEDKIKMIDSAGNICVLGYGDPISRTEEYKATWFCNEGDITRGHQVYIRNDNIYTNIEQTGSGQQDDGSLITQEGFIRCGLVWDRQEESDGDYVAKWDCTGNADSVDIVDIDDAASPTNFVNPTTEVLNRLCRPQLSPERLDDGGYNQDESTNYRTNPVCNQDTNCGNMGHVALESLDIKTNNKVKDIVNEVKWWINLILRNNCEDDRKLRERLKFNKYVPISKIAPDPSSSSGYDKNMLTLNNAIGRRFLQSHFENDKYWLNNNVKAVNPYNPFEGVSKIHSSTMWKWGTPDGYKTQNCIPISEDGNTCDFR